MGYTTLLARRADEYTRVRRVSSRLFKRKRQKLARRARPSLAASIRSVFSFSRERIIYTKRPVSRRIHRARTRDAFLIAAIPHSPRCRPREYIARGDTSVPYCTAVFSSQCKTAVKSICFRETMKILFALEDTKYLMPTYCCRCQFGFRKIGGDTFRKNCRQKSTHYHFH